MKKKNVPMPLVRSVYLSPSVEHGRNKFGVNGKGTMWKITNNQKKRKLYTQRPLVHCIGNILGSCLRRLFLKLYFERDVLRCLSGSIPYPIPLVYEENFHLELQFKEIYNSSISSLVLQSWFFVLGAIKDCSNACKLKPVIILDFDKTILLFYFY